MSFKFELGNGVTITLSNVQGKITARSEYLSMPNLYQVHFVNKAGDAVYEWILETDLTQE